MPPQKSSLVAQSNTPTPRVAILVDTSTSWGRRIIQGVSSYVRKHGPWQLFLEARGMEERLRVPEGWQGDGVIARVNSLPMLKELQALHVPTVNVSGIRLGREIFPQVTTNVTDAGNLALAHFFERGFKNFAYFSVLGVSYVGTQKDAFVQAVRASGHSCSVYSVKAQSGAEPNWNLNLTRLGEWIKELPKPVGILTWNASGGREILYACHLAGLLVPEEVAVLSGSDDDVLCEHLHPPLSGIFVDAEQIGHAAAALLHRLMQGRSAPTKPTLISPLGVVTRQSTDTLAMHDRKLIKAISFIRKNAARPIQVSDVTRHAGLSRRVLERRFMQILERSPASEIRRVHLERARRLLLETKLSIPEVAEASGYGSPEYLANAFKSHTGKTPLEYRKTIRS
ncbi:MAG: substrate-binding domain-containing protein [Verrucomicrobia bacterium]|nr:substrate-binding domain-containing protein [Verrucomicrobiota bacterium]